MKLAYLWVKKISLYVEIIDFKTGNIYNILKGKGDENVVTLTQMQYFQAVCKYENYTKAANALYVSQPAISQAIKDVEAECGVKLLMRKGNGLFVTDAGRVLLEEVNNVLRHVDNLQAMVSSAALTRNFVRIGISTFSSSSVFPQLCAEFHRRNPNIRIISYENSNSSLFEMLDSDRVDLIITSPRLTQAELDKKYRYHDLALSGIRYFVSKKHPWAPRKSVTLKEISEEPLIILSDNYSSSQSLMRMFSDNGLEPNILLKTSQMFTVERFVEAGATGGFLPAELAETNKNIVAIPFSGKRQLSRTTMIWKRDSQHFPSVDSFLKIAKELYPTTE